VRNPDPQKSMSCGSLFLDSGAFTMRQLSQRYAQEHNCDWRKFYDTAEFWTYCDEYVEFVKTHQQGLDLYATIDAIPDPDLSWRNQQYLESKGIHPVPVVHLGTDMKWIRHYMERDYEVLGLGGMVAVNRGGTGRGVRNWLDKVFTTICDPCSGFPRIKTHGFGLMGPLVFRYPFYSVDSTTWVTSGSYGRLLVPKRRQRVKGGQRVFVYDESPISIGISSSAFIEMEKDKVIRPGFFGDDDMTTRRGQGSRKLYEDLTPT